MDENSDGSFRIDHLQRDERSLGIWKRPRHDDIQDVVMSQILTTEINGEWDFKLRSYPVFRILNEDLINNLFDQIM